MEGSSGRLGAPGVYQHFWSSVVVPGGFMCCLAMHPLEQLLVKTRTTFFMTSIPAGKHYIILGDFNARVGSRIDNNYGDDDDVDGDD